jgi:hypothetical protein
MPNMAVVTPCIRFFFDHNARGIMLQGAYQSPGSADGPMRCWVWAKQLWDPTLDTRALMRDFVYGYYGEAAEPLWRYQELQWRRWEEYHRRPGKTPQENPLLADIRYTPDNEVIAGDFTEQALALFAEAEKLAKDPETIRRVKLAKLPVAYAALCQGIGFLRDDGQVRLGKRVRGAAAKPLPDTLYEQLLAELEETVAREQITHFAEGSPDAARKIAVWKELLAQKLPAVSYRPLGATWRFRTDPEDVGVKEAWFGPAVDDAGWAEVRSDRGSGWESQGFANYTGVAWYRQRVVVPAELAAAERLYLLFAAVDEDAEVWVNGEKAFTHTCEATGLAPEAIWTTPFAFDVRPLLKEGENLVAVRVNNRQGMGGIWKPAYFVTTDADADARLLLTAIDAGE